MRPTGNRTLKTWLAASWALCAMGTLFLALTWRWAGARGAQAPPVLSVQDVGAAGRGNKQAVGAEGMNKAECELSISRREPAGATDTVLRLVVSVKNNSQESIFVVVSDPLKDYRFEVKDEHDNAVPLSERVAKALNSAPASKRIVAELKPGEQTISEIDLGRLYNLPAGARYVVRVSRRILMKDKERSVELRSESVRLDL